MSTPDVPLIDIAAWRAAGMSQREVLAERLDRAMQDSGFFLVAGHGIEPDVLNVIRDEARAFFALPRTAKEAYRTHVGGRGWLAQGDEANAFYGTDADPTKADLKESLTFGREHRSGDAAIDAEWFPANRWPDETPGLRELCEQFAGSVRDLYLDLVHLLAVALKLPESYFCDRVRNSPHTFNINRYPPLTEAGRAREGQFRVAPHTDWGMLTILDRQPGYGGLQVQGLDGSWTDAPYVEGAFTVNIADMLARWTGDRWRSTRHRVLPPPPEAPTEELISLIMFMEADMNEVVAPLGPPIGGGADYAPVVTADYFRQRAAAASAT